jgi:hypothetical protein
MDVHLGSMLLTISSIDPSASVVATYKYSQIIIHMIPYIGPLRRSMRLFRTLLLLIEIERFDRGCSDLAA